jgi:hypothetical protein
MTVNKLARLKNIATKSRKIIIDEATKSMKGRRMYFRTWFDFCFNNFFCCKRFLWWKPKGLNFINRYRLFKKAEEKFTKEFDASYYVTTMRKVHMLISILMDDKQRFITNYQHFNLLTLDEESSSSDSNFRGIADKHLKKIPHMDANWETVDQHSLKIDKLMVFQTLNLVVA